MGILVLACAFPAYPQNASAPAGDSRMQQLEDRLAIEHLLTEYGRTLDDRDFAAYSKLFAVNG